MYIVYLDGELFYHPSVDTLPLVSGKLDIELNKTGKFIFEIYKNNARYGQIKKMQSIIKIYDDDCRIFRGRVLNAKRSFLNKKQVTCEGELAFFLDSRVRPYTFEGSVEEYFSFLVESHNVQVTEDWKKFKVGQCTVTDPNDYITRASSDYPKTLNEMKEKLVDLLGGYLWTREEDDGVYIDYLADFELTNAQKIKFGENLLDLEEVIKGQDVATVIIPLGCKLTDEEGNETSERLTIKEVNNGLDYICNEEAVEKYGWIEKVVKYNDVTLAENLLKKAQEDLVDAVKMTQTIDLSGTDLHVLDVNIQAFRLGKYTVVESEPHDFNDKFLTRKQSIDILKPANSSLSLGDERKTFVDKSVETSQNAQKAEDTTNDLNEEISKIEDKVIVTDQLIEDKKLMAKPYTLAKDVTLTTTPQKIISINFEATEDTMPIFLATVPLILDKDGNVIFEYRINGATVEGQTLTKYLERGSHFVTLSNYFNVNKDKRETLTVMAHMEYFESDTRIQDAKIASILDYINTGVYTEQAVDTTIPGAKIPAYGIRAVLFAQGLTATEFWDGTINLNDIVPEFTVYSAPTFAGLTDEVQVETQDPTSEGFSETVAFFTVAASPTFNAPTDRPMIGYVIKAAIRSVENPAEWTFEEEYINTGDGKFALSTLYTYTSEEQTIDSGRMCSVTIKTDDKASVEGVSVNG